MFNKRKKVIVLDEAIVTLYVQGNPPEKIAEEVSKQFRRDMQSSATSFAHKKENTFGYSIRTRVT